MLFFGLGYAREVRDGVRAVEGKSSAVTSMEPIRETVEAVNELDPSMDEEGLLVLLTELARRGQELVPDLVGVSIARLDQGVTFTLVATSEEIAVLDAIQYLAGGPCVDSAHTNEVTEFNGDDALDEEAWHLFTEATAAHAVRSTLTLPIVSGGRVGGTVNLYAASRQAFVGNHDELAEVFGAWAAGATTNADLSFATLREARKAPAQVRDQNLIAVATGLLAAELGVDVDTAAASLQEAALRGGASLANLARDIVSTRKQSRDSD
jgi:GAF domain-containing protein